MPNLHLSRREALLEAIEEEQPRLARLEREVVLPMNLNQGSLGRSHAGRRARWPNGATR
jgi:hypothetical protein